jgi:predicted ATP-binding protein involved in virulence
MKIHSLQLQNYKKYKQTSLSFSDTTLLVGENGSGKTSILDALSTILSIWFVAPPEQDLLKNKKNISPYDRHISYQSQGDRGFFVTHVPCSLRAEVTLQNTQTSIYFSYATEIETDLEAPKALEIIQHIYSLGGDAPPPLCPILAYYGAARAWIPSHERPKIKARLDGPARRWDAFDGALEDRIRFSDLQNWFLKEALQALHLGHMRPGFEVVKRAILHCIPQAQDIWFDADMAQIVLSIDGNPQPFRNLSAGQRMMLSMVADLAIRAVQQNSHLIAPSDASDPALPRVLRETPGVVLIDEIDAHLHPRWQRSVLRSLRETFPSLQFIATSHSPQVIGELTRDEIWILDGDSFRRPSVALGADSNWLLDHVMTGARSQNQQAHDLQRTIEDALDREDFPQAHAALDTLKALLQGETATSTQLEASLLTLETLAQATPED